MSEQAQHHPDPDSLTDNLVQLSFLIYNVLGRAASEHGISIIQVRLLGILRDRKPNMLQLAAYLHLDKSSITGLVDRAERRGMVERATDSHDQRVVNVSITAAGRKLVEVAAEEITQDIRSLLQDLSAQERAQLADLVHKILRPDMAETELGNSSHPESQA